VDDPLARIEEKLDKIITLLSSMDPDNVPMTFPWTSKLLIEHATGKDQDGNGIVYGIDFALSQTHSSLPAALRAVAEYIDNKYQGRRITLTDYANTLDAHLRAEIFEFVSKIGHE
jgi:hypothetical protein